MEFIMNEAGCENLLQDMLHNLKNLGLAIQELENAYPTVKEALGDDYGTIFQSLVTIHNSMSEIGQEYTVLIQGLEAYLEKVRAAKEALTE